MAGQLTVPRAFALDQVDADGRRSLSDPTFDTAPAGAAVADLSLRGALSLGADRVPVVEATVSEVLAGRSTPTPFIAAVIGLLDATATLQNQFGRVDRALVREVDSGSWYRTPQRSVDVRHVQRQVHAVQQEHGVEQARAFGGRRRDSPRSAAERWRARSRDRAVTTPCRRRRRC